MPDIEPRVEIERAGRIAVIVIANPPVNAGSLAVRQGLLDCIARVQSDPQYDAGVLIGAGGTFISGSDLKEFEGPLVSPQLPQVIGAIAGGTKPIVAALQGAALGGGYELALGCDMRVATPDTIVGLPEVTLGIIPGAGGTQRLPRLVGIAAAIEIITSGRRVKAEEALRIGMIDAIAEGDLREAACAAAAGLVGKPRSLVIDRPLPAGDEEADQAAEDAALRKGKRRPQVIEAIRLVRVAASLPPEEALKDERATFERLRASHEAKSLRYLFFAERETLRDARLRPGAGSPIARPAVIGGGTMGVGIAIAMLDAGFAVKLAERDDPARDQALARIADHYESAVRRGRIGAPVARERQARLLGTSDLATLEDCDFIVEAVFEDIEVKLDLMAKLEAIAAPEAILATNTSYLSVAAIAGGTARPERVLGLHFFSPANVMRLVEVVRHDGVDPLAVARTADFARRLGKMPVIARDSFGFIGNRVFAAYRRQAEYLVEEGAMPEEVDAAVESFGFAMGPFAVADLSGLDIAWRMRRAADKTRPATERYVPIADRLVEMGRLGRKTGAGWYRYPDGGGRGEPDPVVAGVIAENARLKDIAREPIAPGVIINRMLAAMLNEAALVFAEGVAGRAADIDLVLVNGYGFPPHEGGVLHWARRQPRPVLREWQEKVGRAGGSEFRPGDLDLCWTLPDSSRRTSASPA